MSSPNASTGRHPRLRSELALVAVAALAFATSSPLAKSTQGLSFAGIAAGRCAVAAAVLWAVAPRATWRAVRGVDGRTRTGIAGAGLLLAAHFALFLGGVLTTSLAAAAAFISLEPLAVVIAAWIAFGEKPGGREQLGIMVAAFGAAVVAQGAGHGEQRLLGDLLVLGSVVLYGAYVAFARGLRDPIPATPYAACVYLVAAASLAPLAVLLAYSTPAVTPPSTWAAVAALGLIPTLIGHTLIQRAARIVPASAVALVSPGETVGSILIGSFGGHAPQPMEWAGAALVVVGATIAISGLRST